MKNFGMIYLFECKKIMRRRMVYVTVLAMVILIICANIGGLFFRPYEDDEESKQSVYEQIQESKRLAQNIAGSVLDDTLIEKMQAAYEDGQMGEKAEEERKIYQEIYYYVLNYLEEDTANISSIDAGWLYQSREDAAAVINDEQGLTEIESVYWKEQEKKIAEPFTYEYHMGSTLFLSRVNLLTYLSTFLIIICLAGVFPDEHTQRTDQLILCARYGKKTVYMAKMAAGVTFGAAGTILFYLVEMLSVFAIYGTGGFSVVLQWYLWTSSWNISIGVAILLFFAVSLAAAVFCSILMMIVSELLKNSVAALSAMSAVVLMVMFCDIPVRYRVASQIYQLLPAKILNEMGFIDKRLFVIFGHCFTNFAAAAFLYLVAALIMMAAGKRLYQKYQVSGR